MVDNHHRGHDRLSVEMLDLLADYMDAVNYVMDAPVKAGMKERIDNLRKHIAVRCGIADAGLNMHVWSALYGGEFAGGFPCEEGSRLRPFVGSWKAEGADQ